MKALRQRGLEAWGVDHSPWAIGQAEPPAKPFLRLADVTSTAFDRRFDVVVVMSVLESLTEEQLDVFLPLARSWSAQAMLAVIATVGESGGQAAGDDRDLAHITMRDRAWWIRRFLAADWRQDAIHRRFEQECRRHRLPQQMHWDVFVLSPGDTT